MSSGRVFAGGGARVGNQRVEQGGSLMPLWPSSRLVRPARRGASRVWTFSGSSALEFDDVPRPARRSAPDGLARRAIHPPGPSCSDDQGEMPALQAPASARGLSGRPKTSAARRSRSAAGQRSRRTAWSAFRPSGYSRLLRGRMASMAPSSSPCGVICTRSPTAAPAFCRAESTSRSANPSASSYV